MSKHRCVVCRERYSSSQCEVVYWVAGKKFARFCSMYCAKLFTLAHVAHKNGGGLE